MLLMVQMISWLNYLTIIGHMGLVRRMIMSVVNVLQTHSDTRQLPLVTKIEKCASAHFDGKCELLSTVFLITIGQKALNNKHDFVSDCTKCLGQVTTTSRYRLYHKATLN